MNTLLRYEERGNFGNNKYRGNFSGKMLIELYNFYKFKSVSDYMCGSNTTGDFAKYYNIPSNTYDLNMGFDLVTEDIKERNKFIIFHPPYWDIIKYSGFQYGDKPLKNDLSNIKNYNDFIRVLNYCVAKQFSSLETGGRMAILMADVKKRGKLYSMLLDMCKPGTVEQIIIKEQINTMSENKIYKNENFIRIAHEYLLILRKDNTYLYEIKITKDCNIDIRDSLNITWKDLVAAVLEKFGGKAELKEIYNQVEGHKKTNNNNFWKEKIRQTLQNYTNIFKRIDKGIWQLVV